MSHVHAQHSINVIRQPFGSKVRWAASVAMTVGGDETIASVQTKARRVEYGCTTMARCRSAI